KAGLPKSYLVHASRPARKRPAKLSSSLLRTPLWRKRRRFSLLCSRRHRSRVLPIFHWHGFIQPQMNAIASFR
ncbi:hypothetical protein JG688_00015457, partial [Phytophthora aleatoria]